MGCAYSFISRFCWCDNDAYTPPETYDTYRADNDAYNYAYNYAGNLGRKKHIEPEADTSGAYNVHLR